MKLTYLLSAADAADVRVANQALLDEAALLAADGHAVTVVSHTGDDVGALPDGVVTVSLVDPPPAAPTEATDEDSSVPVPPPSVLVPSQWEPGFTAAADAPLRRQLLQSDADVLVTAGPGLASAAARLLPETTALVYQEHRAPSATRLFDALVTSAARIDLVATTTPSTLHWLNGPVRAELAAGVELRTELVPDTMPEYAPSYRPRSTLESPLIISGGGPLRGAGYSRLLAAFGKVAEELPGWRLRVLTDGKGKGDLIRPIRKFGLYDRVEVPDVVGDLASEWARGSFSVHVSRSAEVRQRIRGSMAAGLPAISFDQPSGSRYLIDHGHNGLLVPPASTAGMARAIHRLATDVDLRRRLGAGALATSEQQDPTAATAARIRLYEEAHRRRRTPVDLTAAAAAGAEGEEVVETPPSLTPREARALALSWAGRAAESAAPDHWFVIPPGVETPATVVLPLDARTDFLDALAAPDAPAELSLVDPGEYDWPFRREPIPELAAEARSGRTPFLRLEPWPGTEDRPSMLAQGCAVDLEFWDRSLEGELVAARRNRYIASVRPGESFVPYDVDGVTVRTLPLMTRATVYECHFPIDVVYTWVDGSDPAWETSRTERLADLIGTTAATRESSGRARFVSRDELRYSMRSVHLFAPWVRQIHLVTAGQVPTWLADHPMVRVIDHKEILPPEALPTFNSHAIEAALHRIPGLAEHWIYFNDDMFLGRPLRPEAFFTPAGQATVLPEVSGLGEPPDPGAKPWIKAAWNNQRLLAESVGAINTMPVRHAPYPHRTSTVAEMEARFPDAFRATQRSPFRSDTDVSVLSSLAQHFGLATGQAVIGAGEDAFLNISGSQVLAGFRRLLQRENDFFCLGDHHDHALQPDRLRVELEAFLEEYFPVRAPWERT